MVSSVVKTPPKPARVQSRANMVISLVDSRDPEVGWTTPVLTRSLFVLLPER